MPKATSPAAPTAQVPNPEQPALQPLVPEAPMPEESPAEDLKMAYDEDMLDYQRLQLRKHMGLPAVVGGRTPEPPEVTAYFFLETAAGRAKCKLMTCDNLIEPGRYRVALTPSMSTDHWTKGKPGTVGMFLETSARALVTLM